MVDQVSSLIVYAGVLGVFAVVEAIIGVTHQNVHLIRDCLQSSLMIGALLVSHLAI